MTAPPVDLVAVEARLRAAEEEARDFISATAADTVCSQRDGRPLLNEVMERRANPHGFRGDPPLIVCLCGSTRFKEAFEQAEREQGKLGRIVLTVSMFGHSGDLTAEECADGHPVKTALDELHKRKIDLADVVLVLNVGGYVGTSTRSEIDYAEAHGKPVSYLEPLS